MSRGAHYRLPPQADWEARASALGLKRLGGELVGPCPACGGTDRFRVTQRGGVFCRQCCPDGKSIDPLRRIVEAAGFAWPASEDPARAGNRRNGGYRNTRTAPNGAPGRRHDGNIAAEAPNPANSGNSRASGAPPPHDAEPDGPGPSGASGPDSGFARRMWKAAAVPPACARAYLASRGVWPPVVPPPWSVRWLSRKAALGFRLRDFPAAAAGAVAFAFVAPADRTIAAVGLEALTPDGALTAPRWRRTYGTQAGSVFVALPSERGPEPFIHVVEGATDALAVAAWRGEPAWATGGTAGMKNPALATDLAATGRPVVIETDGDGPGWTAAMALQDALMAAGGRPRFVGWRGCDPAEGLSAEWLERAALFEVNGMDPEAAESHAWNALRLPREAKTPEQPGSRGQPEGTAHGG